MRFKFLLIAVLCCATQGAVAQSLDQLTGKSAFVRNHLNTLKRHNSVSAYASTKPYCPSVYWTTRDSASNRRAKEGYLKSLKREMKMSGFSAQSIKHCADNSGFVFKTGELQPHPKNASELRFVRSGILIYRKKDSTASFSMPVLVEVRTYGKDLWRIYNDSFKEICSMTDTDPGKKVNCSTFGTFSAHWTSSDGRRTMTSSNSAYEMIIVTDRTPNFAKTLFRKTFGG